MVFCLRNYHIQLGGSTGVCSSKQDVNHHSKFALLRTEGNLAIEELCG